MKHSCPSSPNKRGESILHRENKMLNFPYSATSSWGVASFLLFWRNNAHSQGKWIHFCSHVSIFIYIYTGILGTFDLALPSTSFPGHNDERVLSLCIVFFFFFPFFKQLSPEKWPLLWLCNYRFEVLPFTKLAHLKVRAKGEMMTSMGLIDSFNSDNKIGKCGSVSLQEGLSFLIWCLFVT